MEETVLLSTAYFPSIEYINCLISAKNIVIEQFETFPKQTYRNRCLIYSANGVLPLSIPIEKPNGNNTKTNEVIISYYENWVKKHWRAIESAYGNSPFFLYYQDELKAIFDNKHVYLLDLNTALLKFMLQKLNAFPTIKYSANFIPLTNNFPDFRYAFSPKKSDCASDFPEYYQVFSEKHGFIPNLSILDLLFNEGSNAISYINLPRKS